MPRENTFDSLHLNIGGGGGSAPVGAPALLLEDNSFLLLEDGSHILLE